MERKQYFICKKNLKYLKIIVLRFTQHAKMHVQAHTQTNNTFKLFI